MGYFSKKECLQDQFGREATGSKKLLPKKTHQWVSPEVSVFPVHWGNFQAQREEAQEA